MLRILIVVVDIFQFRPNGLSSNGDGENYVLTK